MATPYAGSSASYPANVSLPDDGDDADEATFDQGLMDCADRIAYLRLHTQSLVRTAQFIPFAWTGGHVAELVTHASDPFSQRFGPWNGILEAGSGTDPVQLWALGIRSFTTVITGSSSSIGYLMRLDPTMLIQGRTLSSVAMRIDPAAAHGGLPALMPGINIGRHTWSATFNTATTDLISSGSGWAISTAADVTAYELPHTITYTANQNNVIDHTQYCYTLCFTNEGGTNALAGGRTSGLLFTHT